MNSSLNAGSSRRTRTMAAFLQPHDDRLRQGRDGRDAQRLPGKGAFTEKVAGLVNRHDGFLALLRDDSELRGSALDIEDGIGRVSLPEDDLPDAVGTDGLAAVDPGEKRFWIEWWSRLNRQGATCWSGIFGCFEDDVVDVKSIQFSTAPSVHAIDLI